MNSSMKKFLIFICFLLALTSKATSKETTYDKQLFDKALSEGKVVVVSSWIKYCSSCAGQMEAVSYTHLTLPTNREV